MRIGIPKESFTGETRVAASPKTVEQLRKLGFDVAIESGAGSELVLLMNCISPLELSFIKGH